MYCETGSCSKGSLRNGGEQRRRPVSQTGERVVRGRTLAASHSVLVQPANRPRLVSPIQSGQGGRSQQGGEVVGAVRSSAAIVLEPVLPRSRPARILLPHH